MTKAKRYAFSFIAIVVIPAIMLLLLELGLRLAGVGISYDYFYEIDINDELYYQDNREFAYQFYPTSLGIAPLYNTFTANHDDDLVRVYILGGSAAQGFPHVNHGINRHLDAHLRAALPGKKIEIINTGMTSVNSHVVYEVAKGIPENSADFAVILMGNNEVVGPYGPSTFSQNFSSSMTLIRLVQALKRSRIYQAMSSLIEQAQESSDEVTDMEWRGMQMFTEFSVPHDDPRLEDVYRHYETNLRDIIDILNDKNIKVLLSSVPVNLRHSAPFSSQHGSSISEELKTRWDAEVNKGNEAMAQGDWAAAVEAFESAVKTSPDHADTHFKLATGYENLEQHDQARQHYVKALDLDTLRFRSSSRINDIINTVANEENDALIFVDNAAAFDQASAPYTPGWNLLHEHVHFDFPGNYLLASEITRAIMSDLGIGSNYRILSMSDTEEWIGFPNHETVQLMGRLESMVGLAPFTNQSNAEELLAITTQRKNDITAQVGSPDDVLKRRQPLVDSGNADWKIHFELAALNDFVRNKAAVKFHYQELFKLHPHSHESHIKFGELLAREGSFRDAIYYIEKSMLYARGDELKIIQALGLLGLNYLRIDDYDNAAEYLTRVIDEYSHNIPATLRAYGLLIRYARDKKKTRELNRYLGDVQRYAERLINQGKDKDFPLLYRRMAQIMTLVGNTLEAQNWQARQPSPDKD